MSSSSVGWNLNPGGSPELILDPNIFFSPSNNVFFFLKIVGDGIFFLFYLGGVLFGERESRKGRRERRGFEMFAGRGEGILYMGDFVIF